MRTIVLVMGLGGCAVVSPAELDRQLELVDADGDGVPVSLDCDDNDARKRPATLESAGGGPCDGDCPDWEQPDRVDIPADGIDNDCQGGDLLDADGDLFPTLSYADYARKLVEDGIYERESDVPWPTTILEQPVDCDDLDPATFPGASDLPYDGLDRDCQRDNDFDADGDGQMPPTVTVAAVEAYAAALGLVIDTTDPLAFQDCRDVDATVFAGNPVDEPYDGRDSDCSGDNDFDADGDGYMPSGFSVQYATFLADYHADDDPPWLATAAEGDCLDQSRAELGLPAEQVFPGNPVDAPYDGVDADCAGDSDFDADQDGYDLLDSDGDAAAYVLAWQTGDPPSWMPTITALASEPGDCDDTTSAVAPGSLEVLGDALDADCDGQPDGAPFGFSTLAWDRPSAPVILRNDRDYTVSANATWAVRRTPVGANELANAALMLTFSASPTALPGYLAEATVERWANLNPNLAPPLSAVVDATAAGGRVFLASSNRNTPVGPNPTPIYSAMVVGMAFTGFNYGPAQRNVADVYEGFDADVELAFLPDPAATQPDEGIVWTTSCGGADRTQAYEPPTAADGTLRQLALHTPIAANTPLILDPAGNGYVALTGNTGDVCWQVVQRIDADNLASEVHVCDVDGCVEYAGTLQTQGSSYVASFAEVGPSAFTGRGITEADVHDDLLVLVESAGLVAEELPAGATHTLFAGEPVLSGDVVVRGGMLYAVAVLAGTPQNTVQFAYGPVGGPLVTTPLAVEDPNPLFVGGVGCDPTTSVGCEPGRVLDPRAVALHVDDDRVAIAVSAWTPSGYVPSEPLYGADVGAQDAVGWIFMAPPAP